MADKDDEIKIIVQMVRWTIMSNEEWTTYKVLHPENSLSRALLRISTLSAAYW
jgi:hypothetical protein